MKNNRQDRGAFLNLILLLVVLPVIQNLYTRMSVLLKPSVIQPDQTFQLWINYSSLLFNLLIVVAIIGIRRWKRWGVYLLFISLGLNSFPTFAALSKFPANRILSTLMVIFMVIELSLLFWAITRKRLFFK